MTWKTMLAKYPGTCILCGKAFKKNASIRWDNKNKQTVHNKCFKEMWKKVNENINSESVDARIGFREDRHVPKG